MDACIDIFKVTWESVAITDNRLFSSLGCMSFEQLLILLPEIVPLCFINVSEVGQESIFLNQSKTNNNKKSEGCRMNSKKYLLHCSASKNCLHAHTD